MSFKCNLCSCDFTQKKSLNNHLEFKRCKSGLVMDYQKLNNYIEELHNKIKNNGAGPALNLNEIDSSIVAVGNNNTNINLKLQINVNPITNLNLKHLDTGSMKSLVDMFDKNQSNDRLNLVLSDYIKKILCDNEHPENQAVKYISKRPPTYKTLIKDEDGKIISVIKDLKNTCELLTDPVLEILKKKLNDFIKKYKNDNQPDIEDYGPFQYGMIEDAVNILKQELRKDNVKKALKNVLRDDILNNIEMKLSISET